ncbi:QcrA and Rieske domain-containing protein [Desulfogranum mediterraneum]|uniref:QcrA and Rieske domain-containing protein n=1 Tax=Desulfogranum mediterraneum TaxID=160661 RepID=UPI000688800D|nr:Rieske (2Fe-2S) protein [Desulfogranum mediterraneum]
MKSSQPRAAADGAPLQRVLRNQRHNQHQRRQQCEQAAAPLSRRGLLLSGVLLGVGLIVCRLGAMLRALLSPPVHKNTFGGLVDAGTLEGSASPGAAPRAFPQGRFWLLHNEEGLSALHSSCTHLECLFSWDQEQQLFVCPCHGSRFTRSGEVLNGPARRNLDQFPVRLLAEEGRLLRETPEAGAGSLQPLPVADLLRQSPAGQSGEDAGAGPLIRIQVDTARKRAGSLISS